MELSKKPLITALTIAGFDGSGGAGIQADIKTFSALGCYAMSALTALPVQNTTGVKNIYRLPVGCIKEQCEAIFEDIEVHTVKIGMLFDTEIIKTVSKILIKYKPRFVVLDPVMISKSGHALLEEDAVEALAEYIFPFSNVVTPNIDEASRLVGKNLVTQDDLREACEKISQLGPEAVLIKGGHGSGKESNDLLYVNNAYQWFKAKRIDTKNVHGTGCTMSAAIAAFLGRGHPIQDAVKEAKRYLTLAIEHGKDLKIGHGQGPVCHFW